MTIKFQDSYHVLWREWLEKHKEKAMRFINAWLKSNRPHALAHGDYIVTFTHFSQHKGEDRVARNFVDMHIYYKGFKRCEQRFHIL